MKPGIKVIGCGVSGLTVGITLLEAGYEVEIITEKLPAATTSSKAAAIWFPYEVRPREKANAWSKVSYHKFLELCQVPESGVSLVPLRVLVREEKDAWWIDALPSTEIRKAANEELPTAYPTGFLMNVPLIETQIYLDFLLAQFQALNGRLTQRKVSDFAAFNKPKIMVVNCTGLHSRELLNDRELYPIHGQIVKIKPQAATNCTVADFTFDDTGTQLAYVVPRKDCLVLGGTSIKGEETTSPKPELTAGVIERCKTIAPQLKDIEVQSVEVGLRPGRSEIRLEQEGNIIHNYGHGGGGFTVSWGCALEVKELLCKL